MPEPGIYGWSPGNGGVHHYRIAEPLRVAAQRGVRTAIGRQLDNEIAEQYDTILVHMLHHAHAVPAWRELARLGDHRLVLDVDDAMWAPDWQPFIDAYSPDVLERLYRSVELAHVVTTPSEVIATHLRPINPNVHVVPNTVPEYVVHQSMRTRAPAVGWQGSASHAPDITAGFARQLGRFLDRYEWTLRVWGDCQVFTAGHRVERIPWQDSLRAYYRSLTMDIGVGPLTPSMFTASKSGLRAIEYAAIGVPAVLSLSPAYEAWVEHGVTGFLVAREEDWYAYLAYLAAEPDLRIKMGREARDRAAGWTTEANINRWMEAWNSV